MDEEIIYFLLQRQDGQDEHDGWEDGLANNPMPEKARRPTYYEERAEAETWAKENVPPL